jgi:lysozyme
VASMNRIVLMRRLQVDEGLKLKPYRDTEGKLTIGIGRNLDDVGISAEEAQQLCLNDIDRVVTHLDSKLTWWRGLDEERQMAVANMAFNLGIGGLLKFEKMIAALQGKNYHVAADEMLDSVWAQQVGARAHRLAASMRGGMNA